MVQSPNFVKKILSGLVFGIIPFGLISRVSNYRKIDTEPFLVLPILQLNSCQLIKLEKSGYLL